MRTHAEDLALIEAFKRGEESAFAAIVIKYREGIYRVARRLVRSHEDAADITQEVFIRAHRALPRFAGRAQLRTWLYRITVNLCLDLAARRSRDAVPAGRRDDLPVRVGDEPAEWVERRELRDAVARAVELLPPRQRAMVVLRVYQDLAYADIARIMGCAEGTVKATMFAAFTRLRAMLASHTTDGGGRAREGGGRAREGLGRGREDGGRAGEDGGRGRAGDRRAARGEDGDRPPGRIGAQPRGDGGEG